MLPSDEAIVAEVAKSLHLLLCAMALFRHWHRALLEQLDLRLLALIRLRPARVPARRSINLI